MARESEQSSRLEEAGSAGTDSALVAVLAPVLEHRTHRAIGRAITFVEQNYACNLSLREIAASAHLSPFHFSRLFKRHIGLSPHQYLLRVRLIAAYRLIIEADCSITEIATAVGFNDQSHLNRQFRRVFNLLPGALRGRSGSTWRLRRPSRRATEQRTEPARKEFIRAGRSNVLRHITQALERFPNA